MEGYKARGEACKQGGIVSAVLLAFIAASIKSSPLTIWPVIAAIILALAVAFSALAYLLIGHAVTRTAEKASASTTQVEVKAVFQSSPWLMWLGNAFGMLEILALVGGLILTVIAVTAIPTPPPGQGIPTSGITNQQWLAILGAVAGSLGSIITAFSLNSVIRELNIARGFLEVTVGALASQQQNIPVFQGLEKRYHRASQWGNKVVWAGVALLVAGFVLQAISICM
jgi:hypothetical protein